MVLNLRKVMIGRVVQDKCDKTLNVLVRRDVDTIYGKKVVKHRKILVHDQLNIGKVGDQVKIMECRPYSKRKRWKLVSVVEG